MAFPASSAPAAWIAATLLTLGACNRTPPAVAVPSADAALLALANDRPVPAQLRGRFGFKLRSNMMDGSTVGALVVDRPRGHLAVLAPIGGPLLTLHTDGTALSVVDRPNRLHRFTPDAERMLRDATEGLAGVDQVLGLLVGDLELEGMPILERSRTEAGDLALVLQGPRDTRVSLTLDDPLGTPVRVAISDTEGTEVLTADYGAFQPIDDDAEVPTYLPSEVTVGMARFDLTLNVKFKRWAVLDGDLPDVFGLDAPNGFTTTPLDLSVLSGTPPR